VDAATFVRGDFTAFAFLSMGTGAATTLGGKAAAFFLGTTFSLGLEGAVPFLRAM
jgi:hypothetical protein